MNDFAEYPLVAWSMVAAPECLYSSGCFLLQKEAGVAALAAGKGDNESGLASSIGCRYAKKTQTRVLVFAVDEGSMVVPEPILVLELLVR